MSQRPLATVFGQLRQLVGGHPADDEGDGLLLERFVSRHDESAFAALMRRHGPLVLGTCRRVLGDRPDAEDAYQATFVVLARRAGTLHGAGSLAGWLHAVASRIALKARASACRRQEREQPGAPEAAMPSRIDPLLLAADREARGLLDEALTLLPDKYRVPLVLCYLEGKTNEEAARALGCPPGSMSWRLEKGRELLKDRLSRRGVTLSAGALTVLLAEQAASAAVPAALFEATQQAVTLIAAGQSTAGVLSAQAAAWADGMVQAMVWAKVKLAAACVLAVCLLGAGAGVLAFQGQPADPPVTTPTPPAVEQTLVQRISQSVADWQPTAEERRFDQIGWSRDVGTALRLSAEHGRPVVLITHSGNMALGRSCGGSHSMRGGALASPEIIDLLNRSFVPVYISNEDYSQGRVSATERGELNRLYHSALRAKLPVGSHSVYVISPEGRVLDAEHGCHLASVEPMLNYLCKNLPADARPGDGPVVEPRPRPRPPAAPPGSLVLHLTARYLKQEGDRVVPIRRPLGERRDYGWDAYPSEDWIVWPPNDVSRLLPARPLAIGDTWDLDAGLVQSLLLRCYPPSEENDLATNRIDDQALTATLVAQRGELAWARLDGRLRMKHNFYPGKDNERYVDAVFAGFIEFEPACRRIRNLQLTTTSARYCKDLFGVAVRTVR